MFDNKYKLIINDIIDNVDFIKLKEEKHHLLTNRYNHSVSVSYSSYKICKFFRLDYKSTARAALLHDYFFDSDFASKKDQFKKHPNMSIKNASKITKLSDKEKNIISGHMFPFGEVIPKSREAFIVDFVDDIVTLKEIIKPLFSRMSLVANFIAFILFNFFK